MLESKILGIFKSLDYEQFTVSDICRLTFSSKNIVQAALTALVRKEEIEVVKNKYRLKK